MPEDQKYIYYAAGASADQIDSLPQVGIIKNKGYEMLYLTDAFDEFVLRTLGAYGEKNSALSPATISVWMTTLKRATTKKKPTAPSLKSSQVCSPAKLCV